MFLYVFIVKENNYNTTNTISLCLPMRKFLEKPLRKSLLYSKFKETIVHPYLQMRNVGI